MTCLICYEDWKPLFSAHEMDYNNAKQQHLFHRECLREWFKLTKQAEIDWHCPLCRQPLSGFILSDSKGIRPPKALNLALWLAVLGADYDKVQRIFEDALQDPDALSCDILDSCYVFAVSQNRPVLLGLLDGFCGKGATPCLAYAIAHNHPIWGDAHRALQLAILLGNGPMVEKTLERTAFRMSTDFWYLQQALVEKGYHGDALLKPIFDKVSTWTVLRIGTKLWWLLRRKEKRKS
jgi:hypothetical protein